MFCCWNCNFRGVEKGIALQLKQSLNCGLPLAGGVTDFEIEFYNLGYVQNIAV